RIARRARRPSHRTRARGGRHVAGRQPQADRARSRSDTRRQSGDRSREAELSVTTDVEIPLASSRESASRIEIPRPKRSRFFGRFTGDSDLDWRAEVCTKLLTHGWSNIRVEDERVVATA